MSALELCFVRILDDIENPHVTDAAFNYEKFVDHIAQLCCWKDHPTGKFGKKKEEKFPKE
jgi:hypothetical protein